MTRRYCQPLLTLAALLVFPGCGVLSPSEEEQLGVIHFHGDTTVVYLPTSVSADSTFAVRFHTFGGGCVRAGRTGVARSELTATVTPIDTNTGGQACTDDLRFLQHEALVRFITPGPATIVVQGGSEPDGGTLELRFSILVEERQGDRG